MHPIGKKITGVVFGMEHRTPTYLSRTFNLFSGLLAEAKEVSMKRYCGSLQCWTIQARDRFGRNISAGGVKFAAYLTSGNYITH